MASQKLEERIDRLRQLRASTPDPDGLAFVRKCFEDRSGLIVAEAAKTVAAHRLDGLTPQMLAALDRFFDNGVKTDPKCWAKIAIARTLVALEYDESPPFVRGLGHIQMEPVWGGREDTAAALREVCALALIPCGDLSRTEKFRLLVETLNDAAEPVRAEAVRAIGQLGGDEAELLLRLKVRIGDARPLIVGHIFDTLLSLKGAGAISFVAGFLQSEQLQVRDEAALAMGASRLPEALPILIQAWRQDPEPQFGAVLLRALSASRTETAIGLLLNVVRTAPRRMAVAALDALKLHEGTPEIQSRVEVARKDRSDL